MDYATDATWKNMITIPVKHGRSPLNDSKVHGLKISFNDAIKLEIYLDIVTSSPFSVFLAVEATDSCQNYEVMSLLQCTKDCVYAECPFQYAEMEGYHDDIQYCRFKCQITTKVYIRYKITRQMKYLPTYVTLIELAAMAI